MLGIPLGLMAANAFEWYAHKYILHEAGRNKTGPAHFHAHPARCGAMILKSKNSTIITLEKSMPGTASR